MEKVKYSGECELKTRTAYQQGCFFPTMLRIQEVCCERNTDGCYPIKRFINTEERMSSPRKRIADNIPSISNYDREQEEFIEQCRSELEARVIELRNKQQ